MKRIVWSFTCLSVLCAVTPAHAYSIFGTKWDPGANTASTLIGTPGGATFSIMGSGLDLANGDSDHNGAGSTLPIQSLILFDPAFDYVGMMNWALDEWASVSGFTNLGVVTDGGADVGASEANDGHLGDIRVGAWPFNPALGVAHGFAPNTQTLFGGPAGTVGGDIHFEPYVTWDNDDFLGFGFDIRTVALHEVGHALGLDHSDIVGSVMEEGYHGVRHELTADDIAGIQALYGTGAAVPLPAAVWAAMPLMGALVYSRYRKRLT